MSRTMQILMLLAAAGCGSGGGEAGREPSNSAGSSSEGHVASSNDSRDERRTAADVDAGESNQPSVRERTDETEPVEVGRVFRRSDNRPKHDDERLGRLGIQKFASERLVLYTDLEANVASRLPSLVDLAYEQWVAYFGELPPTREGTPFQITGYLMKDERRFREAGLIPGDLPRFLNGRHRDYEFWMYDQDEDYYRRHLVLHEATHCFTTCVGSRLPVWYLEGVAELFATHSAYQTVEGTWKLETRVLPGDKREFGGLGRITLIEEAVSAGESKTLSEVAEMPPAAYLKPDAYAWAWAATRFFDGHPAYGERFRKAGQRAVTVGESFDDVFDELLGADEENWRFEWLLFARDLQHGYDEKRAAVVFDPSTRIRADRGWQSTGGFVALGRSYSVTANGRFTLANEPVPWVSEANGISIRYIDGRPVGQLLGCVRTAKGVSGVIPLGNETTFVAPADGTLYLRLNDSFAELADNQDGVDVTVTPKQ